jgi:hypothetical protein
MLERQMQRAAFAFVARTVHDGEPEELRSERIKHVESLSSSKPINFGIRLTVLSCSQRMQSQPGVSKT